ncbi:Protein kinase-like domain [Pseudocohnilembus persalinus]|uniref:mitogen-activated protein kinase kinase n=1 Tax=Pseudocohnilembus persalinus TaxID=266149 RepID=A0A0V0QQP4_PSEPJ|nr:Protein kinase-like domain [Pseudocohnilembus persalinus]|eukprot:KRX04336.1 Protein kinase-like domain [Pseudocohnilembus persalinus]
MKNKQSSQKPYQIKKTLPKEELLKNKTTLFTKPQLQQTTTTTNKTKNTTEKKQLPLSKTQNLSQTSSLLVKTPKKQNLVNSQQYQKTQQNKSKNLQYKYQPNKQIELQTKNPSKNNQLKEESIIQEINSIKYDESESLPLNEKIEQNFSQIYVDSNMNLNEIQIIDDSSILPYDWNIDDVMIGKGSVGKVYRAIDLKTNKYYALKFVEFQQQGEIVFLNLINEINLLRIVQPHQNIVKFEHAYILSSDKSIKQQTNSAVLVMELCDCNLDELIQFRIYLSPELRRAYELNHPIAKVNPFLCDLYSLDIWSPIQRNQIPCDIPS